MTVVTHRWPELICPFKHEPESSWKGFFSTKIESIWKDVECVFGIMKKRWKILDYGIRFSDMQVVEKVFTVCCMLHNNMLSEMESRESDVRVGHGTPLEGDGIWLQGNNHFVGDTDDEGESRALSAQWSRRRAQLADHFYYCAKRDRSRRSSTSSS